MLKTAVMGQAPAGTRVVAVTFSPDGKTVLTGGTDNTARLWDAATGQSRGAPSSIKVT